MSQNQIAVTDFYAEDVFPQWKKLVKNAKISVVIFSPFVNKTLNDLLNHVSEGVKIEIITRIDKDSLSGIGGIAQVKALIHASHGTHTSIFELPGLHAKILLVDEEFVAMGSQNFTKNGRKSKEASMASMVSFSDSGFLRQVVAWKSDEQIRLRNTPYLEEMLSSIEDLLDELTKNRYELGKKIEEIKLKYEKHGRQEHDFVTKGPAILTLNGKNNLKCANGQQLTSWKKKSTNMQKGAYYPVINLDTKRIVFARVNKREISFIDDEKIVGEHIFDDKPFNVKIVLPKIDSEESNVKIVFKIEDGSSKSIELRYMFDGKKFILKSNKNTNKSEKRKIISELEASEDTLFSFFQPSYPGILDKEHIGNEFANKAKYKARIKVVEEVEFMVLESL